MALASTFGWSSSGPEPPPHSDLIVTSDHAMLVDGDLCEDGALTVYGTPITCVQFAEFDDSCTVYPIETVAHEIILSSGTPRRIP